MESVCRLARLLRTKIPVALDKSSGNGVRVLCRMTIRSFYFRRHRFIIVVRSCLLLCSCKYIYFCSSISVCFSVCTYFLSSLVIMFVFELSVVFVQLPVCLDTVSSCFGMLLSSMSVWRFTCLRLPLSVDIECALSACATAPVWLSICVYICVCACACASNYFVSACLNAKVIYGMATGVVRWQILQKVSSISCFIWIEKYAGSPEIKWW